MYFPEEFPDPSANYTLEVIRKALYQCKLIRQLINGEVDPGIYKMIRDVDEYQIGFITPKDFDQSSPDYFIKKMELSFEHLCTSMEELGIDKPQELSVFSFYSKIQYFKKNKKPQGRP